jgi:hypothetical protein
MSEMDTRNRNSQTEMEINRVVRLTGVTLSGGLQLITMNGKADGFQLFRPAFPHCHVSCIINIAINPPWFSVYLMSIVFVHSHMGLCYYDIILYPLDSVFHNTNLAI